MSGKQLYCGRVQKKAKRKAELKEKFEEIKLERINRYQGVNLYVKNLDVGVDEERLRNEFSKFGTITSAKVMEKGGRSRGYGFVCFSSPEEATKAVTEMNGHIINGKALYVALAQRKEDRRAHLASQHIYRMTTMHQQNVQYNPIFNTGGAGYFVPTMPQAQRGFFTPASVLSIRQARTPWAPYVRPSQAAAYPTGPSQMPGQSGASMPQPGQNPLTAGMLAAAPPQEQKQMLEERLFPLIQRMYPDKAGKITDMLLEIDNSELLHMLESHESLKLKLDQVLESHESLKLMVDQVLKSHESMKLKLGHDPLTASMLAAAPPQEQKQMLGERLFPLIQRMYPVMAGKITDMLLKIDNSELLHMLESHESLKLKVEEAVAVLQAHQAKKQAAAAASKKE